MSDNVIEISNVKKSYRLGQIGTGSLILDAQSWWAKKTGKEDPNSPIGFDSNAYGEIYWALDGINLCIKKGEALGIIGGNGAGKSTLLKLISRITAPTEGKITIKGRVVSMLEVGTGFNGDMTGRENIYLNGAILGMSKSEIDAKLEDIVEFSECRQFIDTPVKRYSSGMYVKLAFSVASHLDSDIMIVDEVLSVGDTHFQNKCLSRMAEVAQDKGKTILYVSHNLSTVRQLCTRCIVMEKGKKIYDGDVEKAVSLYTTDVHRASLKVVFSKPATISPYQRVLMQIFEILGKKSIDYSTEEKLKFCITWKALCKVVGANLRCIVYSSGVAVAMYFSEKVDADSGSINKTVFEMDLSNMYEGAYVCSLFMGEKYALGNDFDRQYDVFTFNVIENKNQHAFKWQPIHWGTMVGNTVRIVDNISNNE